MEDDTYQAMQLLVNQVEDLDDSSSGTFVLSQKALDGRFGGMVAGLHVVEQNLFLLRAGIDQELRINHEPVPMNAVVMLAPGEACETDWAPRCSTANLPLRTPVRARRRRGPSKCTTSAIGSKVPILKPFINSALKHAGQLVGIMGGSGSGKSTLLSILNGSMRPTFGTVKLMDVDIHVAPERVAGSLAMPQRRAWKSSPYVRTSRSTPSSACLTCLKTLSWHGWTRCFNSSGFGKPVICASGPSLTR